MKYRVFLALLVLFTLASVVGTGTAHASGGKGLHQNVVNVGCQGGCDGRDPNTTLGLDGNRCWDPLLSKVVSPSVPIKGGVVNLWYSNNCGTNWAETFQLSGTSFIANANVTRASDGRRYDGTHASNDVWSPMVFAPTVAAQDCGSINNWPGKCSPWV